MTKYHSGLTLAQAMSDDEMRAVLVKHMPRIESAPGARRIMNIPLEQVAAYIRKPKRKEKFACAFDELKKL